MTSQADPNQLVKQATELRNDGHALEAVAVYKQAAKLFDEASQPEEAADCLYMVGVSFRMENNREKALPYFEEALKQYKDLDLASKVGGVQRDIGLMHAYRKDYELALVWLKKSEISLAEVGNQNELGITQSKIGLMYIHTKDYSQAEKELKRGLQTISLATKPHNFYIMTTLIQLGMLEIAQEHYDPALDCVSKAYELLIQIEKNDSNMGIRRSEILGVRAQAYFGLDRVDQAIQDTIDSLQLLENISDNAAAVIYENINAAKLLALLKEKNPHIYKDAAKKLSIDRIEHLSTKL